MSSLGEAFRTAREARGLTLSDAAESIHIRSVYLAAIEAEDWPAIGAPVYVRGFIRTYARYLGLDPEEAVSRFAERVPSESPAQVAAAMASIAATQPDRSGPSLGAIVGILVAIVLVAFVGYEYYMYRTGQPLASVVAPIASPVSVASPPAVEPSPTSPAVALATPAAAGDPSPAAADDPSGSPAPDSSAAAEPSPAPDAAASPGSVAKNQLQVRLVQRSWVRVVIDGTTAMEGIFPAGTVRTFTGKTALVRAGNAAGVAVVVAGRSQGAMGGTGDVVERTFTLSQPE